MTSRPNFQRSSNEVEKQDGGLQGSSLQPSTTAAQEQTQPISSLCVPLTPGQPSLKAKSRVVNLRLSEFLPENSHLELRNSDFRGQMEHSITSPAHHTQWTQLKGDSLVFVAVSRLGLTPELS